jgi:hydrogenase maturation protease
MRTFASTHTILESDSGEFLSLIDPPEAYAEAASSCSNIGTWPVLVGDREKGEAGTMLSSPIILYDYPEIAPESPGELFDATEIDEILTLRVLTMTDQEKWEMSQVDEHAREILNRTEALSEEDFWKMHGATRSKKFSSEDFFNPNTRLESVSVNGTDLMIGHRVRIRPKGRADVMDLALEGKIALIESIDQDAENRVYLALVLEEDPGKDLGMLRQPGHRFFYGSNEVEPLTEDR